MDPAVRIDIEAGVSLQRLLGEGAEFSEDELEALTERREVGMDRYGHTIVAANGRGGSGNDEGEEGDELEKYHQSSRGNETAEVRYLHDIWSSGYEGVF